MSKLNLNAAITLGAVLALGPNLAFAETQVRGTPDAVRIEAKNASVDEILIALRNSFGVQFQSSGKLEKQINGTYSGSLQRVLARLLDGSDYVLKTVDGRVELTMLAARQPAAATAAPSPAASAKTTVGPPAAPVAAAAPVQIADATAAPVPGVATGADVPMGITGPFLVAQGPVPMPSTTQGAGTPMPEPTPSTVPPPTGTPTTTQAPMATPNAVAPPLPGGKKSDDKP